MSQEDSIDSNNNILAKYYESSAAREMQGTPDKDPQELAIQHVKQNFPNSPVAETSTATIHNTQINTERESENTSWRIPALAQSTARYTVPIHKPSNESKDGEDEFFTPTTNTAKPPPISSKESSPKQQRVDDSAWEVPKRAVKAKRSSSQNRNILTESKYFSDNSFRGKRHRGMVTSDVSDHEGLETDTGTNSVLQEDDAEELEIRNMVTEGKHRLRSLARRRKQKRQASARIQHSPTLELDEVEEYPSIEIGRNVQGNTARPRKSESITLGS